MENKAEAGALVPSSLDESWADRITKFYLIPEGPFLVLWDQWMVLLSVINCILLSLMAAFKVTDPLAFVICYFIDLNFLLDVFFKFHVAYLQNGFWVVVPKEMMVHYLNSMEIRYDVLCSLPIDIIALGWVGHDNGLYMLTLLRVAKMVRVMRIFSFFRKQEAKLHATFSIQLFKFMSYLITLTHNFACVWFAIAVPLGEATSARVPSWVSESNLILLNYDQDGNPLSFTMPKKSLYIYSFYWTVTTLTTTGYGDIRPQNDGERIFVVFAMTIGIFFFGYISGTIASALSNMDSRRVSYQQKMDAVRQYMSDRMMDVEMQERVIDYYDYLWERNRGIDVKNLFEDMPSTFRSEVALSLNSVIIDKATIFKTCSIGFRRMIAIFMKLYLFTANEYVIHKGDLGVEMFFVTQGRIDVYATEDVRRPTASLIEGAHFGEFQIILGHRHEYSARAVCNTDIYVLRKDELDATFEMYPDDKELVRVATEERYKQAQKAKKSRQTARMTDIEDDVGSFGNAKSRASGVFSTEGEPKKEPMKSSPLRGDDGSDSHVVNIDKDETEVAESEFGQVDKTENVHGIVADRKARRTSMAPGEIGSSDNIHHDNEQARRANKRASVGIEIKRKPNNRSVLSNTDEEVDF